MFLFNRGITLKWIKHDSDANQDAKLQNVLLDYGLDGYGLYWYCIELIAGKVDKGNITFELEHDARIIARNTGSTPAKVEEMMKYFVSQGLFESSEGVITCLKMARRLDTSMTSNPEMRAIISGIKNHDAVMTASSKRLTESCKTRLDKNRLDKNKDRNQDDKSDQVQYEKVKELYNRILSKTLPAVKSITDQRKKHIRARIAEDSKRKDLLWWEYYFNCVAESDFLTGNSAPREGSTKSWCADIDFLISQSGMIKVIEGKYHE